ncbi:MAG: Ku protein [Candidatus Pacearchaeota archaeon]
MPKSIFKGNLSFGLVNIPISLYKVAEPKFLEFHLIHKKCKKPIKLRKYCEYCKVELKKEDITHAIKIGKEYIEFSEEQIKALKVSGRGDIEIILFTDEIEIDPIYFDKAYYVLPSKSEKAYWLFYEILKLSGKIALVKFIFRNKEYLGFIKAYKNSLLLRILHYHHEIIPIEIFDIEKPKIKFSKEEIKLAKELVNKLYKEKIDMKDFRDEFSKRIEEILMKKLKIEIKEKEKEKKKETLVELLKKSVKG